MQMERERDTKVMEWRPHTFLQPASPQNTFEALVGMFQRPNQTQHVQDVQQPHVVVLLPIDQMFDHREPEMISTI